mgnify:CR=1 FL=1
MKAYIIDGLFLTQKITGIQRYAYEITMELDKIVPKNVLEILIPENFEDIPDLKNIKAVKYGKNHGMLWQQIDFAHYARMHKKQCICFTNILPLLYPHGIIAIHDVSYKANPQFFASKRDRISALWHRLNYWCAAHSSMKIITVSEFSKSEIIKYYGVEPERITVVYNAWQHMNRVKAAADTFERYPQLEKGSYYFSMSTLAANKNFKWILYAAKNNPNEQFAIAGGGKLKGAAEAEGFVNLPNVSFLGYVSDEDAKTLMANCKAFLFPTLYEGFGIPPLEAIACGAPRIIVSDTPCMHEIYGEYANYINPLDCENTELTDDELEINSEGLLGKYNWTKSAKKLEKEILM